MSLNDTLRSFMKQSVCEILAKEDIRDRFDNTAYI